MQEKAGKEASAQLAKVYARMREIDAFGAEARAMKILAGLQFSKSMMNMVPLLCHSLVLSLGPSETEHM